jgi:hypothetical protein
MMDAFSQPVHHVVQMIFKRTDKGLLIRPLLQAGTETYAWVAAPENQFSYELCLALLCCAHSL